MTSPPPSTRAWRPIAPPFLQPRIWALPTLSPLCGAQRPRVRPAYFVVFAVVRKSGDHQLREVTGAAARSQEVFVKSTKNI